MAMSLSTIDISSALTSAQAQRQQGLAGQTASVVAQEDKDKLMAKSKEFESFYLYQVLELMSPQTESEFDGGVGEEMFRHNLNEQMAKNLSNTNSIGISDAIYAQLLKKQEALVSAQQAAAAYTDK